MLPVSCLTLKLLEQVVFVIDVSKIFVSIVTPLTHQSVTPARMALPLLMADVKFVQRTVFLVLLET